jgi:hypothetical protein
VLHRLGDDAAWELHHAYFRLEWHFVHEVAVGEGAGRVVSAAAHGAALKDTKVRVGDASLDFGAQQLRDALRLQN